MSTPADTGSPLSQGMPDTASVLSDVELPDAQSDPETVVDDAAGPCAFMEIYSRPRVAPLVQAAGLQVGPSLDLRTGWDFLRADAQEQAVALVLRLDPLVLMLSPPCTVFSQMQHSVKNRRRSQTAWNHRYNNGLELFRFALRLFLLQLRRGRYAVLEHPWLASSWQLPEVLALLTDSQVHAYVFDQCLLGLRTKVLQDPVRKRTKFLTNFLRLQQTFTISCDTNTCNHEPGHTVLQGSEGGESRCTFPQQYPAGMCQALAYEVFQEVQHGPLALVQQAPLQPLPDNESDVEMPEDDSAEPDITGLSF